MQAESISEHFKGITAKRLSAVEADSTRSNQHEFNGVAGLVELFGKMEFGDKKIISTDFLYFTDKEEDIERTSGQLTWYESRKKPRSEHRFYYRNTTVTDKLKEGDLLIFAKKKDETLMLIIAPQGSTSEKNLLWLFSLSPENLEKVEYKNLETENKQLTFAGSMIMEELGIDVIKPDTSLLDDMLGIFGEELPPTLVFSEYARGKCGEVSPVSNPDETIITWLEREEELFRAFEKHIVSKTLKIGFGKDGNDVDEFISFSLSVHNRRKARMGKSLEHHLNKIFTENELSFSHGKNTEGKKTPDFLFPGVAQYQDMSFPPERLLMLGAKSTCKDRWRQVLNEADRIKLKHLVTLQPGISKDQTDEMQTENLQLVVPTAVHRSYSADQQKWLMNLSQFIELAASNENK